MRAEGPASLVGDERFRLFIALPLPGDARDVLVRWQAGALAGACGARIVAPGNLHVTLAFLGNRSERDVERIAAEMRRAARGREPPALTPTRYRETRSVGMLVLEDEGKRATALAEELFAALERIGVYERERRPWLPHVTVLRFREPPRLAPALPGLGAVSPSEVALYHSVLRRSGAQYEVRESVALGG